MLSASWATSSTCRCSLLTLLGGAFSWIPSRASFPRRVSTRFLAGLACLPEQADVALWRLHGSLPLRAGWPLPVRTPTADRCFACALLPALLALGFPGSLPAIHPHQARRGGIPARVQSGVRIGRPGADRGARAGEPGDPQSIAASLNLLSERECALVVAPRSRTSATARRRERWSLQAVETSNACPRRTACRSRRRAADRATCGSRAVLPPRSSSSRRDAAHVNVGTPVDEDPPTQAPTWAQAPRLLGWLSLEGVGMGAIVAISRTTIIATAGRWQQRLAAESPCEVVSAARPGL